MSSSSSSSSVSPAVDPQVVYVTVYRSYTAAQKRACKKYYDGHAEHLRARARERYHAKKNKTTDKINGSEAVHPLPVAEP